MRFRLTIVSLLFISVLMISCREKPETKTNDKADAPSKQAVGIDISQSINKLPEGFPGDFPLPSEYEIVFEASGNTMGNPSYQLHLIVPDAKAASKFYQESLPKTPYKISGIGTPENIGHYLNIISFKGGGFKGRVICSELTDPGSKPTVSIMLGDIAL
jgi:hypothetical protein